VSLRKRAEKREMGPVNGEAEADDREAGENSNEYGEDQKETLFVENAVEGGEEALGGAKTGVDDGGRVHFPACFRIYFDLAH
jgi:hypothetical protein